MERFGDELRGERERRGVSIEAICAATKVASRHVLALEANRFGDMPGGVFRKGILRGYLDTLGLDQSTWMDRFENELRIAGFTGETTEDWAEFAVNVKRNRMQSRRGAGLRWLGVLALLLVLAALGWGAWRYVVQPRLKTRGSFFSQITGRSE
jgi:cytoskeletal protein RodZ